MADRHQTFGGGVVAPPRSSREGERTCIGCRGKFSQATLVRLRWDGGQVVLEGAGPRGSGRGAYVCAKMNCWQAARKRQALGRALRLGGQAIDQAGLTAALTGMITGSPRLAGSAPKALA